jgi:hypothetical protein
MNPLLQVIIAVYTVLRNIVFGIGFIIFLIFWTLVQAVFALIDPKGYDKFQNDMEGRHDV